MHNNDLRTLLDYAYLMGKYHAERHAQEVPVTNDMLLNSIHELRTRLIFVEHVSKRASIEETNAINELLRRF